MKRAEDIKGWEVKYAAILHAIRANGFEVREFYLKPRPRLNEDVNDNGKPAPKERHEATMESILHSLAAAEASSNHKVSDAGGPLSLSTICQSISRRNSMPSPDASNRQQTEDGTSSSRTGKRPTSLDFHPQPCHTPQEHKSPDKRQKGDSSSPYSRPASPPGRDGRHTFRGRGNHQKRTR